MPRFPTKKTDVKPGPKEQRLAIRGGFEAAAAKVLKAGRPPKPTPASKKTTKRKG